MRRGSMRIAVFGGSFDPVHTEHIRLSQAAIRELGLDKLIVMPAHAPPHKPWRTLAKDEERLKLCELAFADEERVEVSDYEIRRGGTSYTYLTCRHFKEKYPQAELFWLVGADMLRDFPTWKNPESILNDATLAVCGRAADKGELEGDFFQRFGKKFVRLAYDGADVSSTKIRVLAGAGMDVSAYTPLSVAEYIQKNGVYRIENAALALSLEKETRRAHSLRVAEVAAKRASGLKISERKAIAAALFHDCAKNLGEDSPYLSGFVLPTEWGKVPQEVVHQFAGAYVAEKAFDVTDREILNAIAYHTSARENMGELEKLIFLADMIEPSRSYEGVEILRDLFWQGDSLDLCLEEALRQTLVFLKRKGGEIFPLTVAAYQFYKNLRR
ncbi:MAG: nicotinate (nicotinamide) nucleotide adenylyltransferase [Clostridiales bacterium]|nr:nicotinate (nicotinamide) nucleotide adenylyltransferase [Clostridiales bacterium]